MQLIEGQLNGAGMRFGMVCGRFNDTITRRLLEGAIDGFTRHGVHDDDLTVVWVPGAFEIPLAAQRLAASGSVDAIIALGAVIKGSTDHYDHVSGQAAAGLQRAQLESGIPIVFEVLTTENIEQAIERSGTKMGNKGFEAAATAIEMVGVMAQLGKLG